ncbi:hypothetical protein TNCV_2512051 [Trichonephila clavipes]|nr:hypothetical protein TNCV_2512051 [Trichonephila clavipes]
MLNDDKIVTSVNDETDEDEDNNNKVSSKGPSNADVFSALQTAWSGTNNNQECCSSQLLLLKREADTLQ